jgi:hypothetical protein
MGGDLGEAEVEDFCVAKGRDEDIGGLDIAMDDAFAMGGVQTVGDFCGEFEKLIRWKRAAEDRVTQSLALQPLHHDEVVAVHMANFVDGADAGMIQGGGGASFALETLIGRQGRS